MSTPRTHISLVTVPDAMVSTLSGIFDVLGALSMVATIDQAVPTRSPFELEIVAETTEPMMLASGLPLAPHKDIASLRHTDIVIVPSLMVASEGWQKGRYPALVEWLAARHAQGATLCSACSGLFLLAETGAFDGQPSTVHWVFAETFRKSFPGVPVSPEQALVVAGERDELVSSGASASWHDLVLYLVSREVGAVAAEAVARFFALQRHRGDAVVRDAQDWLAHHYAEANPVETLVERSGLAERTFKRRFAKATGLSPIQYAQRLRIEEARRRLERTDAPVDEISWKVGYQDPAFFRRLFKRAMRMTPGAYRRNYGVPAGPERGRKPG